MTYSVIPPPAPPLLVPEHELLGNVYADVVSLSTEQAAALPEDMLLGNASCTVAYEPTGWMFGPDGLPLFRYYVGGDFTDPAATVPLYDCSGALLGRVYPSPALGRTVPVRDCAGNVIGYAMGTAPGVCTPAPLPVCPAVVPNNDDCAVQTQVWYEMSRALNRIAQQMVPSYFPSMNVTDFAGNGLFRLFQEGDVFDPAAVIEIPDCDGNVIGWAVASGTVAYSVAIADCAGNVRGFGARPIDCGPIAAPAPAPAPTPSPAPGPAPAPAPSYVPTLGLADWLSAGFAKVFQVGDNTDPAAALVLSDCTGATLGWMYPTSGNGHAVPLEDCSGAAFGYATSF